MPHRVLIVTGSASHADALQSILARAQDGSFVSEWSSNLHDALVRLNAAAKEIIDAILVELDLADSKGLDTFDQLFALAPWIPLIVLSEPEDERQTWEAIQLGAQGSFSPDHFDSYLVPQSLHVIIQRRAVEEALIIEKARANITLELLSDAVIGTDMGGKVDYLNSAAQELTGWLDAEARGQPIENVMRLVNGDTREPAANPVVQVLRKDLCQRLTTGINLIRRNGSEVAIEDSAAPYHDSMGRIKGAVLVFHGTPGAHQLPRKTARQAQYEMLTEWPNRALLDDRIAVAKYRSAQLALLYIELDPQRLGEPMLHAVTHCLSDCVRSSDTVMRLGDTEFVALLDTRDPPEDAARTAVKILAALAALHQGYRLPLRASIGISTYPNDAENAEGLIQSASVAMFQSKEQSRDPYHFLKRELDLRAIERRLIEAHLRIALSRNELVLFYQPKVDLSTGTISSAEALIRWLHPTWGLLPPARFVPIAEACGLLPPIGGWVLRQACLQAKRWQNSGYALASVAVNISTTEFRRQGFVASVRDALATSGLQAKCLQLEIAESVLMRAPHTSAEILRQLKDIGVQLAVDDFGTGYSSLSELNRLPIDVLKIDRSFVSDIRATNGIVVSAVIAMGNSLKRRIVAEGIEEQAQLDFLQARHCDEGQGFLFSQAVNAQEFTSLLRNGISRCAG